MTTFEGLKRNINEAKGDSIVFTFGRFNPPTNGHEKLINMVYKTAKMLGYEHAIYASSSHDTSRNPLDYKNKIKFLKKFFKDMTVVNNKKLINPFFVAKKLSDDGYKHVVMVVGSDRVKAFEDQIGRYVNHKDPKKSFNFDTFKVVSAGERDPDAEGVQGMSASKMRGFVVDDDFASFSLGLPSGASKKDAKDLFGVLKKNMTIEEQSTISDFFDSLPLGILEEDFNKLLTDDIKTELGL